MSRQRPGGLTALAVINFVFSFFKLIFGFLGALIALLNLDRIKEKYAEEGIDLPPDWYFVYALVISAVIVALLIMSGVGYLKLRQKLGRGLGNLYGVLSLLDTGIQLAVGGQFNMFAIVFSIYPLLTLIALNLIFKDDFE